MADTPPAPAHVARTSFSTRTSSFSSIRALSAQPAFSPKRGSLDFRSSSTAVNAFIAGKAKMRFELLLSMLKESRSAGNAKKTLTHLRDLCFYLQDIDTVAEPYVQLLTMEDKKVVRTVHFLLLEACENRRASHAVDHVLSVMEKEARQTQSWERQVFAMRTLCAVAARDQMRERFFPLFLGELKKAVEVEKNESKKRKKSIFSGKKLCTAPWLIYASAGALRRAVPAIAASDLPGAATALVHALVSSERVGVRHALAALIDIAERSMDALVATPLHTLLPVVVRGGKEGAAVINTADTMARVYLTRLCALVAFFPEHTTTALTTTQRESTRSQLCALVTDAKPRVAFEAIVLLARAGWSVVNESTAVDGRPLRVAIEERLARALSMPHIVPMHMAAWRVCAVLAQSYAMQKSGKRGEYPLRDLDVQGTLDTVGMYVRVTVLKTLCWMWLEDPLLSKARRGATLLDHLRAELERHELNEYLLHELVTAFAERVHYRPVLIPQLLQFAHMCVTIAPAITDGDQLVEVFSAIVTIDPASSTRVLESVLAIVDHCCEEEKRIPFEKIRKTMFWMLGEKANLFANEHAGRYTVADNMSGRVSPAARAPTRMPSGTDALWMYDTYNASMKSVVLRLEKGAVFEAWDIRRVCVQALAKLAFRSNDPLRVHLYNFFRTITEQHELGMTSFGVGVIKLLDDVYAARHEFLMHIRKRSLLNDDELRQVYDAHHALMQQIRMYCSVPDAFLPLGVESKSYLATCWEKFGAHAA